MRIVYVCADPGVPVFGDKGCSVHVREIIRAFRARGASVTLLATRLGGPPPADLAGIPVVQLCRPDGVDAGDRERAALRANDSLRSALARLEDADLVYERHSLWSYAAMEHAAERGIPALLEVNAPLVEEHQCYRGLVHRAEAETAVARAIGSASALIAVSDEVATYLQTFGAARDRVRVIPNGVDPGRFHPAVPPAFSAPTSGPVIGFVGMLRPWHGLSTLAEAFARYHSTDPSAHLLVVGDGPGRERLQADLRGRGLCAAASLVGAVNADLVPGLVTSMDVAVAPYERLDGFYFSPLKLFEYMAAGRAVVATAIGQVEAVLAHGRSALLCPPGDAASVAEAVATLGRDPGLRARLGARARRDVLAEHTWDAIAGRILALAAPRAGVGAA